MCAYSHVHMHEHVHLWIQRTSIMAYLTRAAVEMCYMTVTSISEYGNMHFLLTGDISGIFFIFLLQTQSAYCSSSGPVGRVLLPPLILQLARVAWVWAEGELRNAGDGFPERYLLSRRRNVPTAASSAIAAQRARGSQFGCCSKEGEGELIFNWKLDKCGWSSSVLSCYHQEYVWVGKRASSSVQGMCSTGVGSCVCTGRGKAAETPVGARCFVWALELLSCSEQFLLTIFICCFFQGVDAFLRAAPRLSPSHSSFPSQLWSPFSPFIFPPLPLLQPDPSLSCPSFPADPSPSLSCWLGDLFSCSLADVTAFGTVSSRNSYIWSWKT